MTKIKTADLVLFEADYTIKDLETQACKDITDLALGLEWSNIPKFRVTVVGLNAKK